MSIQERLRGFGPLGILAIVVILAGALAGPLASAPLVLIWAYTSETPLTDLGFVRPRSWAATLLGGTAFGIAFKLVMKAVVMPMLGAPAINEAYHYLAGNTAALPGMIVTLLVNAGFAEEVFFRGYLFERMRALLGSGRAALVTALVVSTALFAAAHYFVQGVPGVEQAAVTGLVIGAIFAWRREIWTCMVVHVAFDLTALVLIYLGLEEKVAHLLFTS